jgi:hypothetical protein
LDVIFAISIEKNAIITSFIHTAYIYYQRSRVSISGTIFFLVDQSIGGPETTLILMSVKSPEGK